MHVHVCLDEIMAIFPCKLAIIVEAIKHDVGDLGRKKQGVSVTPFGTSSTGLAEDRIPCQSSVQR